LSLHSPTVSLATFGAAHMKALPGRKSDVRDAEWIAQLLEHELLRPSFVPPPEIRRLRMLTRYRVQLMGTGAETSSGWS
jgi:Transposase